MSKAAAAPAPAADNAPPAKSSKKLIIVIAALLVVIAGGAGFVLTQKSHSKQGKEAEKEEEPAHAEPATPPAFIVMDPFVVNLANPDSARYLQIGITFEASNAKVAEEMKTYTPLIRSRILLVLSNKNVTQLTSIEGKQALMDELVDLARVSIPGDKKDPTHGIRDVHFASFVIQ
jgi:flagellar protein FliL